MDVQGMSVSFAVRTCTSISALDIPSSLLAMHHVQHMMSKEVHFLMHSLQDGKHL